MVVELNSLSQADLQATRDLFSAEKREIVRDRKIKYERLLSRRESQANAPVAQAQQQTVLDHAQQVYDLLAAASAPQAVLDEQQEVITTTQREVDGFEASSSFITDPDAQEIQFNLDVLDYSVTRLDELIGEIDALIT